MTSWLRSINVARNICAHHSRFWNKPSVVQATAGPSSYPHSTLYRRLRIWAPSNHDRVILIKRLSKLNVSTQRRRRWEASRPRDDPDTWPRIDSTQLDLEQIKAVVRAAVSIDDVRNDLRHALVIDLLEGRCCYENLRSRVQHHLRAHFENSQGKFGHKSLDQPLTSDGPRSLADVAAWKAWKFG